MKLTFTNWYNNRNEAERQSSEIDVKGKCVITNYDTREKSPTHKGDLTITVDGQNTSVKKGANVYEENNQVNMNKAKYSIFTAIAGMDGNSKDLTEKDLEKAKKHFNKSDETWDVLASLGVTEIRYDKKAGVATIVIGEKELLRIDFETKTERKAQAELEKQESENTPKAEKTQPAEQTQPTRQTQQTKEPETVKKEKPVSASKANKTAAATTDTSVQYLAYENAISNVARKMGISEAEVRQKVAQIAKNTGCTESLVEHLLITEQFIRTAHNIGDGVLTVGFGHTNNAEHNNKFSTGYTITNEDAFEWFEQDIKDKTAKAKKYFANCNWDEIPQSIRDAIVDISFNRGDGAMANREIYKSLRANLQLGKEYYPASAVRTRQEFKTAPEKRTVMQIGVMKRNCYRFLLAIESLSPEEKLAAMRRFESGEEPYYTSTLKQLKRIKYFREADTLKNDWEEAKRAAEELVIAKP